MKCKVEIDNGSICIVLSAENEFEKTMIDDACDSGNLEKRVDFRREEVRWENTYKDQKIVIQFWEKEETTKK